jgi:acetyl esterase/lipase
MRLKRQMSDPQRVQKILDAARIAGPQPYVMSAKLKLVSTVTQTTESGMQVYSFTPAGQPTTGAVLYLHGGAYIYQASDFHWQLIDTLCQQMNTTIVAPLYPKIPFASATDAYVAVEPLYRRMVDKYGGAALQVMGDSAGGGLALGLVQRMRDQGAALPKRVVAMSPWVDVTMSNPAIAALEWGDQVLSRHGLQVFGGLWAGAEDPRSAHISPLYGDMTGLCPLVVIAGGREIFVPDIVALCAKARAAGVPVTERVYAGMMHAFPVFPMPEATQAVKEIVMSS